MVAHAFSWPPVRLRHVRGGVGRIRSFTSSPSDLLQHNQTSGAFFARAVPVYLYDGGGDAVPLVALRVTRLDTPPISIRTGKHRSFIEDGLAIAEICRRVLFALLVVGGGRSQTG